MSSDDQQGGSTPNKPPTNPAARLRELLSIPERLRTDAQWDEIIDIEISMGPRKPSGNAKSQNPQQQFRQNEGRGGHDKKPGGSGGGGGGGGGGNKHMRKRRPGGGGGNQGGGQANQQGG